MPVVAGPCGGGFHFLEYERPTGSRRRENKLLPYRRMMEMGRPLPMLMVCNSQRAVERFLFMADGRPLLATSMAMALRGPRTGPETVWSSSTDPSVDWSSPPMP